jgi:hypothetical protein
LRSTSRATQTTHSASSIRILDDALLQDAINDHDGDEGELVVISAASFGAELFRHKRTP